MRTVPIGRQIASVAALVLFVFAVGVVTGVAIGAAGCLR